MTGDPQTRLGIPAALRALGAARANMLVIAVAYAIFSLSLLCQPARWRQTPAYANLLAIFPQQAWGTAFAAVVILLAAAVLLPDRRRLPVPACAAGMAITTFWAAAFIVRWATSADTTPETWVSWIVFDLILLRTLALGGTSRGRRG